MSKGLRTILIWTAVLLVSLFSLIGVFGLMSYFVVSSPEQPTNNGFTLERNTFIDICVSGAKEQSNNTVDIKSAESYCGCSYDTMLNEYGNDKMIQELDNLGKGLEMTPQTNNIINQCLTKAF